MSTPDLAAARRAADELVAAGAGRVLLFGSLARGETHPDSDIDLVAIYDDLDYTERAARQCRLEALAFRAAGCPVDVYVTDAPEWIQRTANVPCSLEAHIAAETVELADSGDHPDINWHKEIGLPTDTAGELQHRFADMSDAVARLDGNLRPAQAEADAAAEGFGSEAAAYEDVRFAAALGDAHMIVESAAKATHIASAGTMPADAHEIDRLLQAQPDEVRDAFEQLAGPEVDLGALHLWRQGATYSADRPEPRFGEDMLRAHARAALDIAEFAAEHCRPHGISELVLARYGYRMRRCRTALDQPLRHDDGP